MTASNANGLEIPYAELSIDALRGVVEAFILQEGTDYGINEYSLDEKVAHVMSQLERGEAHVVFDPESQSVHIVLSAQLRTLAHDG